MRWRFTAVRPTRLGGERIGRVHEEHRLRSRVVAIGTLACPRCDAPVAPGRGRSRPREPFECPFCVHDGRVRDFLSLASPARPATWRS